MAVVDDPVQVVLAALRTGDRATLRLALHPYLHFRDGELALRGRTKVLAHLEVHPLVDPPTAVELRDGQIYRWTV